MNINITILPTLPNVLNRLYIINTQIIELPRLPDSINHMWCTYNVIPSLLKQQKIPREVFVYNKNNINIEQTAGEDNEAYLKRCYKLLLKENKLPKEIKLELIHKVIESM